MTTLTHQRWKELGTNGSGLGQKLQNLQTVGSFHFLLNFLSPSLPSSLPSFLSYERAVILQLLMY